MALLNFLFFIFSSFFTVHYDCINTILQSVPPERSFSIYFLHTTDQKHTKNIAHYHFTIQYHVGQNMDKYPYKITFLYFTADCKFKISINCYYIYLLTFPRAPGQHIPHSSRFADFFLRSESAYATFLTFC